MNYINLESTVTKKEAYEAIDEVLCRFNSLIFELNQHTTVRAGNSLGDLADLMETNNYTASLTELRFNYKLFENLSAKGYVDFLKLCGNLSKKFNLKVSIPEDVKIKDSEDVIEFFITSLTKRALDAIAANLLELEVARNTFLEQAEKVDFNDGVVTDLEVILLKRKEYDKAKAVYDEALNQVFMLASSNEIDEALYAPLYQKCNENNALMQDILTNYPMVQFFNGKTQVKTLCKQINKACNDIRDGLLSVQKKIIAGTFPIWELTPLVAELYKEQLFNQNKLIIQDQLNSWKKAEDRKELIITVCSITVSLVGLIIPGGCCLGLLLTKAAFTAAGAVMGTVQGVEDFAKAGLEKDVAYANVKITPEMITLVNNTDVSEATKNYILSGAFLALSLLDIKDTADSVKLIKKLDKLDDVTRKALKQSKRFGEKAFQNIDNLKLNAIGRHKNAAKVFDNISTLAKEEIPVALDFFPGKFNANVIWLGTDGVEAKKVLNCGDVVCSKYNSITNNVDFAIKFEDEAKIVETKMNNLLKSVDENLRFDSSEKIALLKETLPPSEKLNPRTTYIRVQTGQRETFAQASKPFAWVTDPYMLAGNNLPDDFLHAVGFPEGSMKGSNKDAKIWLDVVMFKDARVAEEYVPNEVLDWNGIAKKLEEGVNSYIKSCLDKNEINEILDLESRFPDLIKNNWFDLATFKNKYLDYFENQHIPCTDYTLEMQDLGDLIYAYTGASDFFTGMGATASVNGLESIERGFKNYKGFEIAKMRDYSNIKVLRFEVQNNGNKMKRVYVREVK